MLDRHGTMDIHLWSKCEYYRDLIQVLVMKELRLRYKSTVVGYAWSVLNPLAFALVYFCLFKIVMRIPMENYTLFLICGLFPWQWFANSLNGSNSFFLGNSSLIKKVKFPRMFLVLSGVLNDLIHFLATIPVIILFMVWYHKYPSISWIYQIPLLILIQFAFTYGLALAIATCNLFFRDLERLTTILTTLWFFLTPILFAMSMIPEWFRPIALYGNPMALIILAWHSVFLEGVLPFKFCAAAMAYAVLAYALGHHVFKHMEWRFAEIV